jgi:hypothetical protein
MASKSLGEDKKELHQEVKAEQMDKQHNSVCQKINHMMSESKQTMKENDKVITTSCMKNNKMNDNFHFHE